MTTQNKQKKPQSITNVLDRIAPKVRKKLKEWEKDRSDVSEGLRTGRISFSDGELFSNDNRNRSKLAYDFKSLGISFPKNMLRVPISFFSNFPTDGCPVFVFQAKPTESLTLTYELDYTFFDEFTPINTSEYLVGYDVETNDTYDEEGKPKDRKLLSHQWYFSFKNRRFGVILITTRQVTEKAFITFIRNILRGLIPDNGHLLKNVYASAHFSLIERGFMKSTIIEKERKAPSGKTVNYKTTTIQTRGKQWTGKIALMPRLPDPKARRPQAKPPRVWLHFIDSMNLQPGCSLDALGKIIGIPKVEIEPGRIKEMKKFLEEKPENFYRYGHRDSVVTAEAFAHFAKLFGDTLKVGFQKRIAAYTERYFRNFFKKTFSTDTRKTNWKESFGWVKDDANKRWVISPDMYSFIPFYFGGRNEVFCVGPREQAIYHDLKSAYPTAMLMLPDHNFGIMTLTRGAEVEKHLEELMAIGAFQVVGIVCHFRFKENAKPMFPVRVTEGLIFPATGHGAVMWPEFWTALKLKLLDHYYIDSIIEFDRKDTTLLADETYSLLNKRRGELKTVYKNLLNFYYGKTAQGVKEAVERVKKKQDVNKAATSTITCYPLAAYITSVCRAVVGELLNKDNPCYGITTDGFISPNATLTPGPLCDIIQKRLAPLNTPQKPDEFKFIQTEFSADESLFIKTRGYILIDYSKRSVNEGKLVKMAQMGVSVERGNEKEQIAQFLTALITKEFEKLSWPSFPQLTFDEVPESTNEGDEITLRDLAAFRAQTKVKNFTPMQIAMVARANTTFDMKRQPSPPKPAWFAFQDLTFQHVSFDTEPLYAMEDFTSLRVQSKPNMSYLDYCKLTGNAITPFCGPPQPNNSNPIKLVLVGDGCLVTNKENTERNFTGTINRRDIVTEINYKRRLVKDPTFYVYDVTDGEKDLVGVIFGWGRAKEQSKQFRIIWKYGQPGQTTLRVVPGSMIIEKNYDKLGFETDEGLDAVYDKDQFYVFGDESFLTRPELKRNV